MSRSARPIKAERRTEERCTWLLTTPLHGPYATTPDASTTLASQLGTAVRGARRQPQDIPLRSEDLPMLP